MASKAEDIVTQAAIELVESQLSQKEGALLRIMFSGNGLATTDENRVTVGDRTYEDAELVLALQGKLLKHGYVGQNEEGGAYFLTPKGEIAAITPRLGRGNWTKIGLLSVIIAAVISAAAVFALHDLFAEPPSGGPPVPVGTIISYAGELRSHEDCPAGWKICNGEPVVAEGEKPEDYEKIIQVLSTAKWPKRGGTPLLPDLRGMFLRGGGQNDNKDFHYEGDDSAKVGRGQPHQVQSHKHQITGQTKYLLHERISSFNLVKNPSAAGDGQLQKVHIADQGQKPPEVDLKSKFGDPVGTEPGHETRPNNVAVVWLIKVK